MKKLFKGGLKKKGKKKSDVTEDDPVEASEIETGESSSGTSKHGKAKKSLKKTERSSSNSGDLKGKGKASNVPMSPNIHDDPQPGLDAETTQQHQQAQQQRDPYPDRLLQLEDDEDDSDRKDQPSLIESISNALDFNTRYSQPLSSTFLNTNQAVNSNTLI